MTMQPLPADDFVYRVPSGSHAAKAIQRLRHIATDRFRALGVLRTLQGSWFVFAGGYGLTDQEREDILAAFQAVGTPADMTPEQVLSLPAELYATGSVPAVLRTLRAAGWIGAV